MTRISKTHIRDVVVGDVYKPDEREFYIRIFGDPIEDGRVLWVDFEIYEFIGYDSKEPRRKFLNKKGSHRSPDPVYSFGEADTEADGFVKWDGCTQFDMSPVHVDSKDGLDQLFAAIAKARELAADEMPGSMIHDEYGPH